MGVEALSVDLILKLLPANVALVAAIIAFGNFVPKVWEMVEKSQQGNQQLSLKERELLEKLKQSHRWVTWAVNFIFASIIWELAYIGISQIPVGWRQWVISLFFLTGPALTIIGLFFMYVWIKPWWNHFGYMLQK
jgi:hypothetical protein